MNRSPSQSTRNAPSPRTASEINGCWPRESGPSHITVGMELHELQVAQDRAGAVGQRHPVAGRDGRVGGLREHLPEAATGEHDGAAADRAHPVVLALAHDVQRHAGDTAVVGEEQVDGEGVLDHLDLGGPSHGRDQRALDLGPGGVAAGMGDAVAVVSSLAGQAELAVGVEVEVGARARSARGPPRDPR